MTAPSIRYNPYPRRSIDPNEPGLVAGYTCEIDPATRAVLNKQGNPAYDLIAPRAVVDQPIIGQGGGIKTAGGGAWTCAVPIPTTATTPSYYSVLQHETTDPLGYVFWDNALASPQYCLLDAGRRISISLDAGATFTPCTFPTDGRGPIHVSALYDGTDQMLVINGVLVGQNAVVPVVPVGQVLLGGTGTVYLWNCYNIRHTVSEARAHYVSQLAKRVVWQWTPGVDGEGPAGGILTGTVGRGWTCPLGAATMQFVWRPDLSDPNGGRLALTDSQVVNLNRIDFEIGPAPWFGSFLIEYEVRNPAIGGDDFIIGWTPRRGVDPTTAGSASYWLRMWNNGGGWYRSGLFYQNGAQIDGADILAASVQAGDRNKCLLSHNVDGTVQVYTYNSSVRSWGWTVLSPVEVTQLSTSCLTIAPRGSYVTRVTRYQGAMTPHELEVQTP